MSKLVSIITPTYNREKYIEECIESVLNQTHKNWEMIIVDDGSSDKTVEIVKKYINEDSRIKLMLHEKNYGPYRLKDTYNEAFKISKGEYIAFLDSDDYWPRYKLEEQVKFFAQNDKDIILCCGECQVINDKGKGITYFTTSNIFNNPIGSAISFFADFGCPISNQSLIIKRWALEKIGGFQGNKELALTDWPTETALSLIGNFGYIHKNMGFWRRHNNSVAYNYGKDMKITKAYQKWFIAFLKENKVKIENLGFHYDIKEVMQRQKEIIKEIKKKQNYYNGAFLLSIGNFKEARKCFYKALKQKDNTIKFLIKYKGASVLGILSSYIKIDLISKVRLTIVRMRKAKGEGAYDMGKKMTIDLGCGKHKSPNAIGVDIIPLEGVDIVTDVRKGIPFDSASCDEVIISHFFEHLNEDERLELVKEIYRVLKVGGVAKISCPHSYAFYGYADPTHKAMDKITLNMFDYYDKNHPMHSQYFDFCFKITEKKIRNVTISFPFKNIKICGKLPIRFGLRITLGKLISFFATKWEPTIKYIPTEQAELYIKLEKQGA